MRIDGITLIEDSRAVNLTVDSGTTFPGSPTTGELFYRTDSDILYVYSGAAWNSTAAGGVVTSVDVAGGGTGLTFSGGPITSSGTITLGGTLGIANGGTGQTTALTARNALLPTQATHAGKALVTDGTNVAWTTVTVDAANLTGTTLASGVVSSSLTSVGTITSGTWSGAFGAVSGANLTSLNASNLATGTVGTARLGSGTANSTTFLRGDNTWAVPTASSASSLQGTDASARSSSTSAVYGGTDSGVPAITWTNTTAPAGNRVVEARVDNAGVFQINLFNDALSSNPTVFSITRSGNTATAIALTATAITLTGAVTGTSFSGGGAGLTSLNASSLATGTVGTARLGSGTADSTTFLRGDNTWASPSSANSLAGSGNQAVSAATTAAYAGVLTGGGAAFNGRSTLALTSASATAGNRVWGRQVDGSGNLYEYLWDDTQSAGTAWLQVTRSSNTASTIALTGTAITLTGAVTGTSFSGNGAALTSLNASNLATGTVGTARLGSGTANSTTFLRGDNTWAAVTASTLVATGSFTLDTSTTSIKAGVASSEPAFLITQASAAADNRLSWIRTSTGGTLRWSLASDANSEVNWLTVARSGNTASLITLAGTGVNLAVGASGLQVNGSAGAAASVLTSNGAAAPTWSASIAMSGTVTAGSATAGTEKLNVVGSGRFTSNAANFTTGAEGASIDFVSGSAVRIGHVNGAAGSAKPINFLSGGSQVASLSTTGLFTANGGFSGALAGAVTGSLVASANQAVSAATTAPVAGVLTGGGAAFNGRSTLALVSASATAGNRVWGRQVDGSGNLYEYLWDDTQSAGTAWLQVARSANTASTITLTGTALAAAVRVDFGKSYTELNSTATATASTTIDCSLGNIFTVTMSASITTLAFSNVPASGRAYSLTLLLAQDATGGRSITWPASVKWPSATTPTLSGANKVDIVSLLTKDGGTTWYAFLSGQNY